jgi:hypothetical protein
MTDDPDLDVNERFEAHAYFALWFDCEECNRQIDFVESEDRLSNRWLRQLAQHARNTGWFVHPLDPSGGMGDVMLAWCPDCAAKLCLRADEKMA